MDLQSVKREYALSTNKGIAMFYGGILIWLVLGILSFILPKELNAYIYLGATGVFFPVGILVA